MQLVTWFFDGDEWYYKTNVTWITEIVIQPFGQRWGSLGRFESCTKPTERQIRRWKKQVKRSEPTNVSFSGDAADETYAIKA